MPNLPSRLLEHTSRVSVRRPTLPAFHIQKPSMDDTCPFVTDSTLRAVSPVVGETPDRSFSLPKAPCNQGHGGVWETVVGSAPEEPPADGPIGDIVAPLALKGLPKRKSLTGIFGLAFKRSIDRLRPSTSKSFLKTDEDIGRLPPSAFVNDDLRSLAEEMEPIELAPNKTIIANAASGVSVASNPGAARDLVSQC